MVNRTGIKRLVWVLLIVISFSLILVKSVATAESEFQSDGSDPSASTANDQGINPNRIEDTRGLETTITREGLSLEASNYFIIPAGGFVSDGYDSDGYLLNFIGGYITGKTDSGACVVAAVHLPTGATIEGIEIRLKDNDGSFGESFYLRRVDLETGSSEVIALASAPIGTTDGVVSLIDDTVTDPIVSERYAYHFSTCPETDILVYGVRIGYSFIGYLPTVHD